MATWNPNNLACGTTWTTLKVLDQLDEVFAKSGGLKMTDLTFWNKTSTAEIRKVQATTLANQMDNVFIMIRGAKYEASSSQKKAIADTVEVLIDSTKTVADLAEKMDSDYLFWGEIK